MIDNHNHLVYSWCLAMIAMFVFVLSLVVWYIGWIGTRGIVWFLSLSFVVILFAWNIAYRGIR